MKIRLRLYIYLLILIGVLLYANSLTNSFIGDDFDQIVNNKAILHPSNVQQFFTGSTFYSGGGVSLSGLHYRPLMTFFYSIIYTTFGLKPIFFHLLQLLFHITNTILIFLFLRYFFKSPLAFFLSLLFLVHPINTETVAYIANLQDTLYLFFGLLLLLLVQAEKIKKDLKGGLLIFTLLTLSLFSKETGILFTIIFSLQALLFKKISIKFSIITSLLSILFYTFFRFELAKVFFQEKAIAPIHSASLLERLLNLPAIIFYYIKTFFYPLNLATTQFWINKNITLTNFFLPLFIIILLAFGLFIFGNRIRKNSKKFDLFIFFLTWLLIGLALHSQIIPLEMTVADRWFYFSFIGTLGLIGLLVQSLKISKNLQKYSWALAIIILILLSSRTLVRNFDWKDPVTLYEHDTKVDKGNFFLENSLGTEYLLQNKFGNASPHVKKSLSLFPYFGNLNNMAVISSREGDKEKTRYYLEKAIKIDNNYLVNENYAKFLLRNDTPLNTISFIKNALATYPNNATLWMYYGLAENKLGNYKKAVEYSHKAYVLNPNELTKSTYEGLKGIIIN